MAVYAIVVFFGALIGFFATIIGYYLGTGVAIGCVAVWASLGIIIAAPTIVDRGRPGKLDDLMKYLVAAITLGPAMLTGIVDFYGKD